MVISTQHYLYETKVPLTPHIRSILEAMEAPGGKDKENNKDQSSS